jgi:1-acyl-sn-glycerol-3-phosphate acyltransferase
MTAMADTKPDNLTFASVEATLRFLCDYHAYEPYGLENIPRQGPALLVFHHSLATYDSFLLGVPMYDELGRLFRGLADRLIFRTPGLAHIFKSAGFIEGSREGTLAMLKQGEVIGLAPGGMREGLRSSDEKYMFDWTGRMGFARLSMMSGAPVVLCACPRADDIYTVHPNPVTKWIYDRFKFPLPLARGRWNSPLPRRIKLWHLISEPVYADVAPDQATDADVAAYHARLVARMSELMADAATLGGVEEVA